MEQIRVVKIAYPAGAIKKPPTLRGEVGGLEGAAASDSRFADGATDGRAGAAAGDAGTRMSARPTSLPEKATLPARALADAGFTITGTAAEAQLLGVCEPELGKLAPDEPSVPAMPARSDKPGAPGMLVTVGTAAGSEAGC